jgi:hypothetical protein
MHPTERHSTHRRDFLRDIGLLVGLPLAVAVGLLYWVGPWPSSYEVPEDTDIFAVAAGTWDWTTAPADSFCVARWHSVAFSPERDIMTITQNEPWTDPAGVVHQVTVYDLWEHSRRHVRGQIRGETRLTEKGEPVVWDLVLTSADSYQWRRTDLPSFAGSAPIHRCPAGTSPAVALLDSSVH